MIGATYKTAFARAMFGSARSALAPATLWMGWLSTGGVELSTTRVAVANTDDVWGVTDDGVANADVLDGGAAGAWIVGGVGLWDAPTAGNLVVSAALPDPLTVEVGQLLTVPAGGLSIEVQA